MKYVMGFDGGGTKTDCTLYTLDGHLAAWRRFPGTNHENMAGGFSELRPMLLSLLDDTLAQAGAKSEEVAASVFGAAGVDVQPQLQSFKEILAESGLPNPLVVNDSFLGIKAGLPSGIGCCLVNGTGNTVGGINTNGKCVQVGGTGPMLGEVGGSWLIAQSAIRMAYDELFRLGPATAVTPGVLSILNSTGTDDFVERVYADYHTGNCADEAFVKLLFACAEKGDEPARERMRELGREFARSLAGCMRLLSFGPQVDVVLVGSVTLKASCSLMTDTMMETLPTLTGKTHRFYPLTSPPAAGAVLWALERAGISLTEEIRRRVLETAAKAAIQTNK